MDWESLLAYPQFGVEALDHEEVLKTMEIGVRENRLPATWYTPEVGDALVGLDLLDGSGRLTHAAMLLFAKPMPAVYPQAFLRLGRFMDERMNHVLDSRQVRGNIFELLREADQFIGKHLPVASWFEKNQMERVDRPALPVLAVREAVINALVHRSYSDTMGDVSLWIFNTHLEIHNAGGLTGGMTVASLLKRHPSRRRNPKIAQVFYIRKLIERYGSGTLRMVDACQEAQLRPPLFEEVGEGFQVTFFFRDSIGPTTLGGQGLTERQQAVVTLLGQTGALPVRRLVESLPYGVAARTIGDDLASLKTKGLVESQGVGKAAVWMLRQDRG